MVFLEPKILYHDYSLKYFQLFWILFSYHSWVVFSEDFNQPKKYETLSLIKANGKSFRMSQALHIGHARVLLLLWMYSFLNPNEAVKGPFPVLTLIQELQQSEAIFHKATAQL